ncbi:hypothetical protein BH09MYX1_BH09MYX1_50220 [soil metagenome]
MAGVDVGGGGGKGKRSLDSEINMIPFIDLLMVTIAFLLITAVWSHMARINADAQVPGPPRPDVEQEKTEPEKVLHIEMRDPTKFVLSWKAGAQVVDSSEVPRNDHIEEKNGTKSIKYGVAMSEKDKCNTDGSLAAVICNQWKDKGSHKDITDHKIDQVVLHTDNDTLYVNIIAVIDAVYGTQRDEKVGEKAKPRPAFNITFAVN